MSNEETMSVDQSVISSGDQSFLDQYDSTEATGQTDSGFILKIPEKDSPLVVKFVVNPQWPTEKKKLGYYPVEEYRHRVGTGENDIRTHPDLIDIGVASDSPERDAYRSARQTMRGLEKEGAKNTDAYKKAEAMAKLFQPNLRGWFLIVRPNGDTVECAKLPKDVVNKLWGKKETPWTKEVPSLIAAMRSEGRDPYNPRVETGWVEIFKEGTGLGTRYTVREWVEERNEVINGQKVRITAPHKAQVNLSNVKIDSLPNPINMAKRNAFTLDEAVAFVESAGGSVPERMLKQANTSGSATDFNETPLPGPAPEASTLDDIPF